MKTILNWEKGLFKSTYQIFSGDILVGSLNEKYWTQSAEGELNGRKYLFKSIGFFKPETQIIDVANNIVIGKITYNSWMIKAKIEYAESFFNWKYENCWGTKWSLFDANETLLNYSSSTCKGKMEFNVQNDLFVLTGLFISSYIESFITTEKTLA